VPPARLAGCPARQAVPPGRDRRESLERHWRCLAAQCLSGLMPYGARLKENSR